MYLREVNSRFASTVTKLMCGFVAPACSCNEVFMLTDGDGAAEEMPELSDGDDDIDDDDEEQWQWLEEDDGPPVSVTCLFCDR